MPSGFAFFNPTPLWIEIQLYRPCDPSENAALLLRKQLCTKIQHLFSMAYLHKRCSSRGISIFPIEVLQLFLHSISKLASSHISFQNMESKVYLSIFHLLDRIITDSTRYGQIQNEAILCVYFLGSLEF